MDSSDQSQIIKYHQCLRQFQTDGPDQSQIIKCHELHANVSISCMVTYNSSTVGILSVLTAAGSVLRLQWKGD